jgi:hypothetical protein
VKGVGVDCVGLLTGIARELNLPDVFDPMSARGAPYRGYGREPNPQLLLQACAEYLDEIPKSRAGLGDILLMAFDSKRNPRHFGIVTSREPPKMVHAYVGLRQCFETEIAIPGATVIKAFRFRGVE